MKCYLVQAFAQVLIGPRYWMISSSIAKTPARIS
jgi:hypothetical protein